MARRRGKDQKIWRKSETFDLITVELWKRCDRRKATVAGWIWKVSIFVSTTARDSLNVERFLRKFERGI